METEGVTLSFSFPSFFFLSHLISQIVENDPSLLAPQRESLLDRYPIEKDFCGHESNPRKHSTCLYLFMRPWRHHHWKLVKFPDFNGHKSHANRINVLFKSSKLVIYPRNSAWLAYEHGNLMIPVHTNFDSLKASIRLDLLILIMFLLFVELSVVIFAINHSSRREDLEKVYKCGSMLEKIHIRRHFKTRKTAIWYFFVFSELFFFFLGSEFCTFKTLLVQSDNSSKNIRRTKRKFRKDV